MYLINYACRLDYLNIFLKSTDNLDFERLSTITVAKIQKHKEISAFRSNFRKKREFWLLYYTPLIES